MIIYTITTCCSHSFYPNLYITLNIPCIGRAIMSFLLHRVPLMYLIRICCLLFTLPAIAATALPNPEHYQKVAEQIRHTYETQLFTLPAFKAGHYGLRMYRQTLDNKYSAAVWSDMARIASTLNYMAAQVHTPDQINDYTQQQLKRYQNRQGERNRLRYETLKSEPDYVYLGINLLGSMARANEYGLKHVEDEKLRSIIRRYDFSHYATHPALIKAWAAQLANQVYWLRQLGEQDVVKAFVQAFRQTYPDESDTQLSEQQYANKLYGMTHLILADSHYYQFQVKESDHQWIYDYFRTHIETIVQRAKEDILAEVGIVFLLAGLEDDPVVHKTRQALYQAYDQQTRLIPSSSGDQDIAGGEHRNVLAIMLFDWQGVHPAPTVKDQPYLFNSLPYGLTPVNLSKK